MLRRIGFEVRRVGLLLCLLVIVLALPVELLAQLEPAAPEAPEERPTKVQLEEMAELRKQLEHPMSRVRRLSCLRVGELKVKGLTIRLGELLLDKAQDVRKAAARGLVTMGSKQALQVFRDRYLEERDPRLRYDWIDGASKEGAPSVPFLLVALEDKEYQIRERTLDELGHLGSFKIYKLLAPLLQDGKVSVRIRAVQAYLALLRKAKEAGENGIVDAGLTRAIAMLGDKASEVRARAVAGLVALGTRRIDEELVRLVQDEAASVRKVALSGLIAADAGGAVDVIRRSLDHRDHSIRLEMVFALAQMGEPGLDALRKALAENDAVVVRKAIVEALSSHKGPATRDALIVGLRDASPEVRRLCVQALSEQGTEREGSLLVPLLKDGDAAVRRSAVEAMERLLGAKAIPAFEGCLNEKDFAVQVAYFDVLRRYPTSESLLLLGKRIADPDAGRRDDILEFLATRKKAAVAALLAALEAPDPLFRMKVIEVLGNLGDPSTARALLELLPSMRGRDAATMIEALSKVGGGEARGAVEDYFIRQPYVGEEIDARIAAAVARVSGKPVFLLRLYRHRWTLIGVLVFIGFAIAFTRFVRHRAAKVPVLEEAPAPEDHSDRSPEWILEELNRNIARDGANARLRGLHFKRGALQFHLGAWEDAKTDLEEAHRSLPADAPEGREAHLLYLLGKTYEHLGDKRYAFRKYSQSLKCHDRRALTETMGRIAGQDGQAEDTEASIRMILEGLPFDETIDPGLYR